jgi:hypothetical protein
MNICVYLTVVPAESHLFGFLWLNPYFFSLGIDKGQIFFKLCLIAKAFDAPICKTPDLFCKMPFAKENK